MTAKAPTKKAGKKQESKRGKSPGSVARYFPPGVSGNPNGKKPGTLNYNTRVDLALTAFAHKFVEQYNKKHKRKITVDQVDIEGEIFQQLINKARAGDMKAIDSFLDRRFGKATQPLAVGGIPGHPIGVELAAESKERDEWEAQWEQLGLVVPDKRQKEHGRSQTK